MLVTLVMLSLSASSISHVIENNIWSFVVTSRRSDLEILGYVMLQWLCSRLPWENNLEDKEYVKNEKIRYLVICKYFKIICTY